MNNDELKRSVPDDSFAAEEKLTKIVLKDTNPNKIQFNNPLTKQQEKAATNIFKTGNPNGSRQHPIPPPEKSYSGLKKIALIGTFVLGAYVGACITKSIELNDKIGPYINQLAKDFKKTVETSTYKLNSQEATLDFDHKLDAIIAKRNEVMDKYCARLAFSGGWEAIHVNGRVKTEIGPTTMFTYNPFQKIEYNNSIKNIPKFKKYDRQQKNRK